MKGSISCRGNLISDDRTFVAKGDARPVGAPARRGSVRRDGDGLPAPAGAPFGGEQTDGWAGGRRETAHNVTTAADYRTALLFDSP
jgi:hypothetical protein